MALTSDSLKRCLTFFSSLSELLGTPWSATIDDASLSAMLAQLRIRLALTRGLSSNLRNSMTSVRQLCDNAITLRLEVEQLQSWTLNHLTAASRTVSTLAKYSDPVSSIGRKAERLNLEQQCAKLEERNKLLVKMVRQLESEKEEHQRVIESQQLAVSVSVQELQRREEEELQRIADKDDYLSSLEKTCEEQAHDLQHAREGCMQLGRLADSRLEQLRVATKRTPAVNHSYVAQLETVIASLDEFIPSLLTSAGELLSFINSQQSAAGAKLDRNLVRQFSESVANLSNAHRSLNRTPPGGDKHHR